MAVTACMFVTIPKGFFPTQDTGLITGISEAAQDVSFAEMKRGSWRSPRSWRPIPDVARSA